MNTRNDTGEPEENKPDTADSGMVPINGPQTDSTQPGGQIPLESRPLAEKHGFPGWLMGLGWSVSSFFLFQVVASIVALLALLILGRVAVDSLSSDQLFENLDVMFISNSIGQILFLGLGTWLITRLSVRRSQRRAFLRMNTPHWSSRNAIYAFLIVLVAQPLIMVLAWINLQIPFSESYLNFEQAQLDMIENYLRSDHIFLFTLFHVAIVPSVCEEILFRGYVLKNFEKSMLPVLAIILSGLLFGLYHIRLTQLIPLSVLGMLLAWMTIRTGSIWPAVSAHFANNASAVTLATYFPDLAFDEAMQGELPPAHFIIFSMFFTGLLVYLIHRLNTPKNAGGAHV
ncbi:MAG: putative metal-dependent membrane protease [Bacteroidetes bacterium HLUCCA01]|nr:MAG: putative metal-dependent membrane protease [Bacteroidetes bacterium HLUCCA01]